MTMRRCTCASKVNALSVARLRIGGNRRHSRNGRDSWSLITVIRWGMYADFCACNVTAGWGSSRKTRQSCMQRRRILTAKRLHLFGSEPRCELREDVAQFGKTLLDLCSIAQDRLGVFKCPGRAGIRSYHHKILPHDDHGQQHELQERLGHPLDVGVDAVLE